MVISKILLISGSHSKGLAIILLNKLIWTDAGDYNETFIDSHGKKKNICSRQQYSQRGVDSRLKRAYWGHQPDHSVTLGLEAATPNVATISGKLLTSKICMAHRDGRKNNSRASFLLSPERICLNNLMTSRRGGIMRIMRTERQWQPTITHVTWQVVVLSLTPTIRYSMRHLAREYGRGWREGMQGWEASIPSRVNVHKSLPYPYASALSSPMMNEPRTLNYYRPIYRFMQNDQTSCRWVKPVIRPFHCVFPPFHRPQ